MSDAGYIELTLRVEGDRDELLRRLSSGLLAVQPRAALGRALASLVGLMAVAIGVTCIILGPDNEFCYSLGLFEVAVGVFLMVEYGRREPAARRIAAVYRRSRFTTEPSTVVAAPSGLRVTSDHCAASWTWQCVTEVREHRGGLLLVFDGALNVADLPPSAFTEIDRAVVARHITEWITDANAHCRTPGPACSRHGPAPDVDEAQQTPR
jgi:hypothetical protein